jgi:hypothetical protein
MNLNPPCFSAHQGEHIPYFPRFLRKSEKIITKICLGQEKSRWGIVTKSEEGSAEKFSGYAQNNYKYIKLRTIMSQKCK